MENTDAILRAAEDGVASQNRFGLMIGHDAAARRYQRAVNGIEAKLTMNLDDARLTDGGVGKGSGAAQPPSLKNTAKSRLPGEYPKPVSKAAHSLRCCVPWLTTWARQCQRTR